MLRMPLLSVKKKTQGEKTLHLQRMKTLFILVYQISALSVMYSTTYYLWQNIEQSLR